MSETPASGAKPEVGYGIGDIAGVSALTLLFAVATVFAAMFGTSMEAVGILTAFTGLGIATIVFFIQTPKQKSK